MLRAQVDCGYATTLWVSACSARKHMICVCALARQIHADSVGGHLAAWGERPFLIGFCCAPMLCCFRPLHVQTPCLLNSCCAFGSAALVWRLFFELVVDVGKVGFTNVELNQSNSLNAVFTLRLEKLLCPAWLIFMLCGAIVISCRSWCSIGWVVVYKNGVEVDCLNLHAKLKAI